ncbi:MAG: hypothetical protein DRI37_08820, partial [Chloroflexi bacterium]
DEFSLSLFNKEIQTYEKYLVKLDSNKTLYRIKTDGRQDAVVIDASPSEKGVSQPEKKFAKNADRNNMVSFFFKLPNTYYVETPAGKYIPDWAVVVEKDKKTQVYFVAETKSTNIISNLRQEEQLKILSARAMFKQIMPKVVFKAPVKEFGELTN